jgi:D-alanyl-lipoteichoic acid acyltransferase DltB (MBOAT superfamily)
MSFVSFDFVLFLGIYLILINIFKNNWKIITILFSLFFYSYWNILLCSLLIFTTLHTFFIGNLISKNKNTAKKYLILGLILSLSVLFIFKYFDFFVSDLVNINLDGTIFAKIILPIGISFYTFQSISYIIDIYKKKIEPTTLENLFVFICFFPQLVAGPIVRASNFIPQIKRGLDINLNNFKKGLMLIIWGYFLKLCISNNLDVYVSTVYNYIDESNTPTLILTSIFYSFLIYADFCGYSSIAIGILKILGFNIPANFLTPYFSRSITELWRRWHISLSHFLKDYLFFPLGGSRNGIIKTCRNLIIVMTIAGLWHGASINFVIWGFLHGFFLAIERLIKEIKINFNFYVLRNIYTFFLWTILLIIFSLSDERDLISYISVFKINEIFYFNQIIEKFYVIQNLFLIFILVFLDYFLTKRNLIKIKNSNFSFGFSIMIMFGLLLTFGIFDEKKFIYFQF